MKTRVISSEEFMVHQITYMTGVMMEFSDGLMTISDISKAALKILLLEAQFKLVRISMSNMYIVHTC